MPKANAPGRNGGYPAKIWADTEAIIERVRTDGDAALLDCTRKLDGQTLTARQMQVSMARCQRAWRAIAPELRQASRLSAMRIRKFNEKIRPKDARWSDGFVQFQWRWTPIETVGVYVPGGTAAYPSSVLMACIPAKVAGSRVTVCTPPKPKAVVLAACALAGVDAVFQIGGAQAIAAMTYGTQTVPKVDKIVGPGGAFVDAAKRLCAKDVAIDFPAGPSELVAVAGSDADVEQVAADLVAQAEHDVRAKIGLLALDEGTKEAVKEAVNKKGKNAKRSTILNQSLSKAFFQVVSAKEAPTQLNSDAFEHVALYGKASALADKIRNAGAIYVDTPPALGDYALGSNHVLPTGGFARSAGMLSVFDFLKPVVTIRRTQTGLEKTAQELAESEGLWAHAESLQ